MDTKGQETIKVNTKEHYAILPKGEKVHLTKAQIQILLTLSKDAFLSKRKLDEIILDKKYNKTNTCIVLICRIREILGNNSVINQYPNGYKLGNHIEFIDEVPEAVRFATWLGSEKVNILSDYQKWIELGKPTN